MLDLAFRWIHILSAIALVGGTYFLRFSLAPSLAKKSPEEASSLLPLWRPSWAKVVMATSGLLLISGLFNAVRNIIRYEFPDSPYHAFVAVKLLLALVIFWLSAVLSGRSAMAEKFRAKFIFWLNISVILSTLVVMLGSYMKMAERVPKEDNAAAKRSVAVRSLR